MNIPWHQSKETDLGLPISWFPRLPEPRGWSNDCSGLTLWLRRATGWGGRRSHGFATGKHGWPAWKCGPHQIRSMVIHRSGNIPYLTVGITWYNTLTNWGAPHSGAPSWLEGLFLVLSILIGVASLDACPLGLAFKKNGHVFNRMR